MALDNLGVNHASGLPAMDNESLQIVLGTRLSNYVITQLRRTLPAHLFINIDADIDMCSTTTFLCEDLQDAPRLQDSALDSSTKRRTVAPPKTVSFHGFHKGSFEYKLAKEQLECINKSSILKQWYMSNMQRAVEDGRQSIMARFVRYLMTNGVHPKNMGNNAGLTQGGHVLGTPTDPIALSPDDFTTIDDWYVEMLEVARQMPDNGMSDSEFGRSKDNLFLFGPMQLEGLLMKTAAYNDANRMGEMCRACAYFTDAFDKMPRGIYHITSYCTETRIIKNGNDCCKVYPILFGKRYQGTKASLRVDTKNYESEDGESLFFRTTFYWNIYTYDCRNLGLSYVTIADRKPKTKSCGA